VCLGSSFAASVVVAQVTLCIGVNDQYRHQPMDAYAPRFEALLNRAISLASHVVVVVSIPVCARYCVRLVLAVCE
jgi:hypothetical protein